MCSGLSWNMRFKVACLFSVFCFLISVLQSSLIPMFQSAPRSTTEPPYDKKNEEDKLHRRCMTPHIPVMIKKKHGGATEKGLYSTGSGKKKYVFDRHTGAERCREVVNLGPRVRQQPPSL